MTLVSLIGSITTLLSLLAFGAIVWWAYGRARRDRFAAAARAPFALPDEAADFDVKHSRPGAP
jgi:cbb3-type cytochrome oxidase subunit 3